MIVDAEGQQFSMFDYQQLSEDECNDIGGCSCFIGDEKEDT